MEKDLEKQVREYFKRNPNRKSIFLNEDETEYQNHEGGDFVNEVSRYDLLDEKNPKDPKAEGKSESKENKPGKDSKKDPKAEGK